MIPPLRNNGRPRRPNLLAGLASLLLLVAVVVGGILGIGAGAGAVPPATTRSGAAAHGPPLRVRLVELLDGVAVALHVAVARGGCGVDAAFALLEAGGGRFGCVCGARGVSMGLD